jgi:hypothetical protein
MPEEITPDRVRELLEAATPGPWHAWWDPDGFSMVSPHGAPATTVLAETTPSSGGRRWPNAELIAAAPNIAQAYLSVCARKPLIRTAVEDMSDEEFLDWYNTQAPDSLGTWEEIEEIAGEDPDDRAIRIAHGFHLDAPLESACGACGRTYDDVSSGKIRQCTPSD